MAPNGKSTKDVASKGADTEKTKKVITRPKRTYKRKQKSVVEQVSEQSLTDEIDVLPVRDDATPNDCDLNLEPDNHSMLQTEPFSFNSQDNIRTKNSDLIQTIQNNANRRNGKESDSVPKFCQDKIEDIRSFKKEERENLNFVLKNLPKFTDSIQEDFEAMLTPE